MAVRYLVSGVQRNQLLWDGPPVRNVDRLISEQPRTTRSASLEKGTVHPTFRGTKTDSFLIVFLKVKLCPSIGVCAGRSPIRNELPKLYTTS